MPASQVGNTRMHYKLNNIYSRNLTATSSSFYLCSKVKYKLNILMLQFSRLANTLLEDEESAREKSRSPKSPNLQPFLTLGPSLLRHFSLGLLNAYLLESGCFLQSPQICLQISLDFDPLVALSVCLLYTSPSPRDRTRSRMPSSA